MPAAEAVDIAWLLIAAALVMLMQAGFSALESGLVRTKNSINVAAKNFSDFLLSTAVFWLVGFGMMFGGSIGGLVGGDGFLFGADAAPFLVAFFLFQMGFVGTAATIVSGAVAERMRFAGYLVVTLVVSALIYPVFGHWAWASASGLGGRGWLEAAGFVDFAGSTVVHSVGGWTALAALLVIGPRLGRFGRDRVPIRGHDLPLVTVGVFILWFGWFGFNGGSTLGLTAEVPAVILNTSVSAAFGGMTAMAASWRRAGRPDVPTIMNGALAGLVAITASANIVSQVAAVAIGTVAGLVMYAVTGLLERREIDDAVGAVPVHLAAGIWGTVAVALFGATEAFGPGVGRAEQLAIQLLGVGTAFVWVFGVAYFVLRFIDRHLLRLRIDPAGEQMGLNIAEHGTSTAMLDLLTDMEVHRASGGAYPPVRVEAGTEAGRIAVQYNRVLGAVEERNRSVRLLQAITAAVNEEWELETAYGVALREICEFAGWEVGHVYAVSGDGAVLAPTEMWCAADGERYERLQEVTATTRLAAGEGLPGAAVASREAEQVDFDGGPATDARAGVAAAAGLRAGYAFPVFAGRDVVSVLEFFSTGPAAELPAAFRDLMVAAGTQLGRAVERRRADEARFRTVVDHLPAMVLLRDLEGRFLLVNRRYEEFYRVAGDALEGRTLAEVAEALPELSEWLMARESLVHDAEVMAANRTIERELETVVAGRRVVLASVKFPVPGPGGEAVALGGIEIDITQRKEHEAELAELVRKVEMARDEAMRANQAKSRFLANMSHELRTPLNAIIGFARLVRRKTDGQVEPQQTENLGKILRSGERLMSLIDELLDLSRIEAGRMDVFPTMVDVGDLVADVVGSLEPLAVERGLALRREGAGDVRGVFTDGEKLRQVLVNLVGNAIKFTEVGSVRVAARRAAGQVEIEVGDTGVGIPPEHVDRIFDEFEQIDRGARPLGGTGLGLAISNRLVRLLGGRIEVRSEVGEGSVFTVRLPPRYEPIEGAT